MAFESPEKGKASDGVSKLGLDGGAILHGANLRDVSKNVGQDSGSSNLPKVELIGDSTGQAQDQAKIKNLQVAESYIQLSPTVGAWKYTKKDDGFNSVVFTDTSNGQYIGVVVNGKPKI